MLAAYLVWSRHLESSSAISVVTIFLYFLQIIIHIFVKVKRERRCSVETKVQEESVAAFQESLRNAELK